MSDDDKWHDQLELLRTLAVAILKPSETRVREDTRKMAEAMGVENFSSLTRPNKPAAAGAAATKQPPAAATSSAAAAAGKAAKKPPTATITSGQLAAALAADNAANAK